MKILGYIWTIVLNLLTIIIVLMMYTATYTSFEKIVLSLLIIIYLSINMFFTMWGRDNLTSLAILYHEFENIKEHLEIDASDNRTSVKFIKDKLEATNVKFWINNIFSIVIYIIAIFNILTSL